MKYLVSYWIPVAPGGVYSSNLGHTLVDADSEQQAKDKARDKGFGHVEDAIPLPTLEEIAQYLERRGMPA